jgi:hypothetical protein
MAELLLLLLLLLLLATDFCSLLALTIAALRLLPGA